MLLTGRSGAGKTTIAHEAARELERGGHAVIVIDDADVQAHLDPGDPVGALAWLCRMLVAAGALVLVAHGAPTRAERDRLRAEVPEFVEVLVDAGPGPDAAYEEPLGPELRVPTRDRRARDSAAQLVSWLESQDLVTRVPDARA